MPDANEVKSWINAGLVCEHVDVNSPDGVHFEALVISSKFIGLSKIKQHQLVFGALGSHMHSEIHALSMETLTPEEFSRRHEA